MDGDENSAKNEDGLSGDSPTKDENEAASSKNDITSNPSTTSTTIRNETGSVVEEEGATTTANNNIGGGEDDGTAKVDEVLETVPAEVTSIGKTNTPQPEATKPTTTAEQPATESSDQPGTETDGDPKPSEA